MYPLARLRSFAMSATIALCCVSPVLPADAGQPRDRASAPDSIFAGDPFAIVGEPAPEITLERLRDGNEAVSLPGATGERPIVLQFWTLWCGACRSHLRALESAAREHAGELDVYVVNVGDERTTIWREFATTSAFGTPEWSINLPILLDPTGAAANAFGAATIPHTVVIDRAGVVRASLPWRPDVPGRIGRTFEDELTPAIEAVLAEQAVPDRLFRPVAEALNVGPIPRLTPERLDDRSYRWSAASGEFKAVQLGDGTILTASDAADDRRSRAITDIAVTAFPAFGIDGEGEPFAVNAGAWRHDIEIVSTRTLFLRRLRLEHGSNTAIAAELDGQDGDEVVIGLNGDGGVAAYREGELMWRNTDTGNVRDVAFADVLAANEGREVLALGAGAEVLVISRTGRTLQRVQTPFWPVVLAARDVTDNDEPAIYIGTHSGASIAVSALTREGDLSWTRLLRTQSNTPNRLEVSPDGEVLAVVSRGRLFALDAATGDAFGWSQTAPLNGVTWEADPDGGGLALVFTTHEGRYRMELASEAETAGGE